MNRRSLLLAAPSLLLFGCSTPGGGLTPAQVETDISNAVDALAAGYQALVTANPTLFPLAQQQAVEGALAQASSLLADLMGAADATSMAPIVQQIEAQLNIVISVAATIPLIPPPFSTALGAAAILLPIIEVWLNSVLPASAKVSNGAEVMAARARFATPGMSLAAAEMALRSGAGK
jgi:hypothetical protein